MPLKTVLYISEPLSSFIEGGLPPEFSTIHHQARVNNQRTGITGLLAFYSGRYLQILEGESESVDLVFKTIEQDRRHRILALLVNENTADRFFANSRMRVVASLDTCTEFHDYLDSFKTSIEQRPTFAQTLLSTFVGKRRTKASAEGFNGMAFKLNAWPDFTQIAQSPLILSLSARLIAHSESYKVLVASGEFGPKVQVDNALRAFDGMGILDIYEMTNASASNANKSKRGSENSLYSKIRQFLGLRIEL